MNGTVAPGPLHSPSTRISCRATVTVLPLIKHNSEYKTLWLCIKDYIYMIDKLNMSNLVRYLPSVCSLAASSSSSISSSVLRWIAVTWPAFHLGTIFAEGSSSSPLSSFSFNQKIQFLFLINFTGKIKKCLQNKRVLETNFFDDVAMGQFFVWMELYIEIVHFIILSCWNLMV